MFDLTTIRVSFKNAPWEAPAEEWTFRNVPRGDESRTVDEHALEEDLREAFIDAGGANTLSMARTARWGGRGTDGLTALDIVIAVSVSVMSSALWDGIKAIYKRHTGQDPETSKVLPEKEATEETADQTLPQPTNKRE